MNEFNVNGLTEQQRKALDGLCRAAFGVPLTEIDADQPPFLKFIQAVFTFATSMVNPETGSDKFFGLAPVEGLMRLKDAGVREKEWAKTVMENGCFPQDISYEDVLDHGMYDTREDEIILNVKGVTYSSKIGA